MTQKIMLKVKSFIIFLTILAGLPLQTVFALQIPDGQNPEIDLGYSAKSYLVMDARADKILLEKNSDVVWPPASLTKLVSVMVVLDQKPKMSGTVAISKNDEVGGARLATKSGVKYKLKDLLYASLIASANNAINAAARSTGLSREQFLEKMNQKAKSLGAKNTVFVDVCGISEKNQTTAEDYVKIAKAAFSLPFISDAAGRTKYVIASTNNKRYTHTLTNTNKLLGDPSFSVLGKTGYLEESKYNFASEVKDALGNDLIVVVLGSDTPKNQFKESKELAALGILMSNLKNIVNNMPLIN